MDTFCLLFCFLLFSKGSYCFNKKARFKRYSLRKSCAVSRIITCFSNIASNNDVTDDYYLRFAGVGRLYANNSSSLVQEENVMSVLNRLVRATVIIVGLGGVGSWASEALCRSGIGSLVLVDLDDVCISNMNRQVHALSSTIGKFKIEEMKQRLHQINPMCNVTLLHDFVSKENVQAMIEKFLFLYPPPTALCVLDAIDGKIEKAALIASCAALKIPVVTVGGSAGKTDPTCVVLQDLARVQDDRLLFACRKILRQEYGFKKPNLMKPTRPAKKWHIMAVHSTERRKEEVDVDSAEESSQQSSSFRICDSSLGTACHVTGTFGFVAASCIVDMIANDNLIKPNSI